MKVILFSGDRPKSIIYLSVIKTGIKAGFVIAKWLKAKVAIRENVLALPTEPSKKKRRKTVDVGGRILNISMLEEIDAAEVEKGTKGSKAPKKKSSATKGAAKGGKKSPAKKTAVAVTRPRNRKKNDQAPTRVSKQAQSATEAVV